jgi:RNA polymerase sigma factor (sigma-70 family)
MARDENGSLSIMVNLPPTRPSLLLRMREARDSQSWSEFVEIYTPLVRGYCRKYRLQDADAADVAQDVLLSIATAIRGFDYDPRRGSFRSWLHKVIRSKLATFFEKRERLPQGSGETAMEMSFNEEPAPEDEEGWDKEFKEYLFHWAANKIQPEFHDSTWQAFWQTTVQNRPAKQVAESLGISIGAVYTAKSRAMARLVEEIKGVAEG